MEAAELTSMRRSPQLGRPFVGFYDLVSTRCRYGHLGAQFAGIFRPLPLDVL